MRTVLVAVAAFVLMEPLTALAHRYVMHGAGIVLHRSHHVNHTRHARRTETGSASSRWEANDLFPVALATVVMLGFAIGFNVSGFEVLVPIGVGITAYGAAYALVHDVYIHRRLGWFGDRRLPVFEHLAVAHRRHHERNAAPYGMLAPLPLDAGRDGRVQRMRSGSRPSHDPADA